MRINICWTPIYYVYLNGKRYYFEYGPYVGVTILNQKTWRPTEGQKAPTGFWSKFEAWRKRKDAIELDKAWERAHSNRDEIQKILDEKER